MATSPDPRAEVQITVPQLLGLRLASQGLAPGSPAAAPEPESRAAALADRLLALQGQDLPGALWSFGVRDHTLTREDVAAAFARGELVRSWLFRGTLFVTSARDLRWLLALSADRVLRSSARRRARLGLDPEALARARAAAEGALTEHPEGLVRARMLEAFERADVSTADGRGYHLLFWLSVTGVLVQGPLDGADQRFLLLDEWVPAAPWPTGDAALAELVARYVRGRGPVTEDDLAWWTKLPRAAAGRRPTIGSPPWPTPAASTSSPPRCWPWRRTRPGCTRCPASTNTSSATATALRSWRPPTPPASSPAATGCSGPRSSIVARSWACGRNAAPASG